MKDTRLNQHTVAHDVCSLALASLAGAAGSAVEQSLAVGVLMFGAIAFMGIGGMRITLFRLGVNRLALALREVAR